MKYEVSFKAPNQEPKSVFESDSEEASQAYLKGAVDFQKYVEAVGPSEPNEEDFEIVLSEETDD